MKTRLSAVERDRGKQRKGEGGRQLCLFYLGVFQLSALGVQGRASKAL
jgi:hypothetical protein